MWCSSAARSRTRGAPSAGTRSACSRPTGRAGCPASATRATIPTVSGRCRRPSTSSSRYARAISAPVRDRTRSVTSVRAERRRLSRSSPTAATGAAGRSCWRPAPATSPPSRRSPQAVPPAIATLTPKDYRNPEQLEDGGVLVVGASATGIQLADEIHRSGPPGDACRRRARARAAHLSRQGHPVVDGRRRRARRAL